MAVEVGQNVFASDNAVVPFGRKADFYLFFSPKRKKAWLQHLEAQDKRNLHPQAVEKSLWLLCRQ